MIHAAILISAARVEMWFLGDLLGILLLRALLALVVSCCCSLFCAALLVSSEVVFGELMGFRSPAPYVRVAVWSSYYVRVAFLPLLDDSYWRVPFPGDVVLHPHFVFIAEFSVVCGVLVS